MTRRALCWAGRIWNKDLIIVICRSVVGARVLSGELWFVGRFAGQVAVGTRT